MTNAEFEKLNVRLAKKLGWTNFRKERTPAALSTLRMTGVAPGNFRHQYVPMYTGNWYYAMKLTDWASDNGYKFSLRRNKHSKQYTASFVGHGSIFEDESSVHSLAIALAFDKIK